MVQYYFQYLKGKQQPLQINAVVSIQAKIHKSSGRKSQRQFASCHMENVIKSLSLDIQLVWILSRILAPCSNEVSEY